MERIFLIGYMGAGKTTLGRLYALRANLQFIDLDQYIEQRHHRTVSQLFSLHGEDGFRRIEQKMLHEVAQFEDVVIATGGGTPCFFDNMDFMNRSGRTVFLDASLHMLCSRLVQSPGKRPLLAGKTADEIRDYLLRTLSPRMPYYTRAAYRLDSSRLETPEEISRTIQRLDHLLQNQPDRTGPNTDNSDNIDK